MTGLLLRRQNPRALASKCAPQRCPAERNGPEGPAPPCAGNTPPAVLPVPMERDSCPAIDRLGCRWVWRSSHAYVTSKNCYCSHSRRRGRGSHSGPAQRGRGKMARRWLAWWVAPPWRLGLRRVRLALHARVRDRFRRALLRWLLWRPLLFLWRRLRHAPPLGDQPLGSSRPALDPRLLLDPPLAISGWPPAPRGGRIVSAFGRHVIDDQHADHDADQQRRQKRIFHVVDPFALQ